MKDLTRNITLFCPICGNDMFYNEGDQFNGSGDSARLVCSRCNNVFTREEMIEGNEENININLEEVKEEALKEVKKH